MAKQEPSPAYLMYPSDILSSGRVAALSALEELWYRRALDLGWEHHGMPSDPVEFAGWVGRKCTVAAAEKIIAKFYEPAKKDPAKVVNARQEKERKKFLKSQKMKSENGKNAAIIRWQRESEKKNQKNSEKNQENLELENGLPTNIGIKTTSGYADALQNDAIPIPISIPISKIDLKRLILACVREHPRVDPKIVEIGIYYTLLQRNGDTSPINSLAYFGPQIKRVEKEFKTGDARAGITAADMMRSADMVLKINRAKLFPDERPGG